MRQKRDARHRHAGIRETRRGHAWRSERLCASGERVTHTSGSHKKAASIRHSGTAA